MKKLLILGLFINSFFGYTQQSILKLQPSAVSEASFQTALIPTTNQYNNTVEWLKTIHDSIDKRKISSIVNEEINISGIAKDVWGPP